MIGAEEFNDMADKVYGGISQKQTTIMEFIKWLNQYEDKMISTNQIVLKAYNFLEKEKEELKEAFDKSRKANIFEDPVTPVYKSFEEYYKKTYGL